MTDIDILNRRFGEALGFPNGADPRFAWKYAPDLVYFWRPNIGTDWERRSWGSRLGKSWVLCQWRPPEVMIEGVSVPVTREQWFQMHGGSRPYPQGGEYAPYAETALPDGRQPTAEDTAFYIATLRLQMAEADRANRDAVAGRKDATTERCEAEAQASVDAAETQFMEQVADWQPASWRLGDPHEPGDHDGPVAYQVGGLRDQISV